MAIDKSHGTGRGRTYTLSAQLYQSAGQQAEYIRQAGFSPIQHEQMVLNYVEKNKTIKRADVADLCRISPQQATRLLKHLIESQDIKLVGDSEGTRYERITEIIVRIRSVAFDYARFRSIACRYLYKR